MKLIAFSILIIVSFSFTMVNSSTNQLQPSGTFELQSGNNQSITIFQVDNITSVILEVNVTHQETTSFISYEEKLSGSPNSFILKEKEIFENETYYLNLNTDKIWINLQNLEPGYVNLTSNGFYRIHTSGYNKVNPWKSYNLQYSGPYRYELFQTSGGWINNVTINLNVTEIVGGKLTLGYSYSDFGINEEINKTGSYSYTINATQAALYLEGGNYTRAKGSYVVIDHGKLYQNTSGFEYTGSLLMLALIAIKVRKREKFD